MLGWLAPAAQAPMTAPTTRLTAEIFTDELIFIAGSKRNGRGEPRRDANRSQAVGQAYFAAAARFAAEVTALRDAATMFESIPTPHRTLPFAVSASMKLTAWASEPAPVACW